MTNVPLVIDRILPLILVANTAIFYVAARLYLFPLIARPVFPKTESPAARDRLGKSSRPPAVGFAPNRRAQQILVPILLLHSMRVLGMMFLDRGATYPGMPPEFAYPAAFGDFVTAIIAFAAIPLLLGGSRLAKPIVWIFNIFGTIDLLAAITTATIYGAPFAMGATYWIPSVAVPALIVTHYVTFVLLLRRWDE